jgi:hypothetical protein
MENIQKLKEIVDPKIYDIVVKFNKIGLSSQSSCAGIGMGINNKRHRALDVPYVSFKISKKDIPLCKKIASLFLFDPLCVELPKTETKQKFYISPKGIGLKEIQVQWGNQFSLVTLNLSKHQTKDGISSFVTSIDYSPSLFRAYFDIPSFFVDCDEKEYNTFDIRFGQEIFYYMDFLYSLKEINVDKLNTIFKSLKLMWLKHVWNSIKKL